MRSLVSMKGHFAPGRMNTQVPGSSVARPPLTAFAPRGRAKLILFDSAGWIVQTLTALSLRVQGLERGLARRTITCGPPATTASLSQ